jgi:hypothetical protein
LESLRLGILPMGDLPDCAWRAVSQRAEPSVYSNTDHATSERTLTDPPPDRRCLRTEYRRLPIAIRLRWPRSNVRSSLGSNPRVRDARTDSANCPAAIPRQACSPKCIRGRALQAAPKWDGSVIGRNPLPPRSRPVRGLAPASAPLAEPAGRAYTLHLSGVIPRPNPGVHSANAGKENIAVAARRADRW